jgi:preprotein translocase subunit SecA
MTKRKPIEQEHHVHGPDCDHGHDQGHDHHEVAAPYRRSEPKIGRNDPCRCGSGKKFKKCHGANG